MLLGLRPFRYTFLLTFSVLLLAVFSASSETKADVAGYQEDSGYLEKKLAPLLVVARRGTVAVSRGQTTGNTCGILDTTKQVFSLACTR